MARRAINGEAVRAMRELLGVNQPEFARRCGITQGALSHVEGGDRNASPQLTRTIADQLGVSLDAITIPLPEPAKAAS